MSRFSPGYRTTNLFDQYRRMETGVADAIAGAENLYDTRRRQDKRQEQIDRELADREARTGLDARITRLQEGKGMYDWGYLPEGVTGVPGEIAESGQQTPSGQGQTIPNVSGMPTIEGEGTPVAQEPQFRLGGSGVPHDMNGLVDGRQLIGNGEAWLMEESPAERKAKAERDALIEMMLQTDDYRVQRGRTPEQRRANAGAVVAGLGPEADPTQQAMTEMMMERMFGRSRQGSGTGNVPPGTFFTAQVDAAENIVLNRAAELVAKWGMGETDALYRARMELAQDPNYAGIPVAVSVSDLDDFFYGAGRERRWQSELDVKNSPASTGNPMRDRVQGGTQEQPAQEDEPADEREQPGRRVQTWRRDRR